MPLKPRTPGGAAPTSGRSRILTDAPVTTRERPQPVVEAEKELENSDEQLATGLQTAADDDADGDEPSPQGDTLDEQDAADKADGDEGDEGGNKVADPSTEVTTPTRRARRANVTPALADGVDPKARLVEIGREVKQLKSEYTAELKSLETHFGEKLKALRSEHDLLNTMLVEATFTL